jgi:hypothetical protein
VGHPRRKAVDLIPIVCPEPDCHQRLDRPADRREAELGFKALDDPSLGQRTGPHEGGGGGNAHQLGQLLVGDPRIVHQGGEEPLINGIQWFDVASRPDVFWVGAHGISSSVLEFILDVRFRPIIFGQSRFPNNRQRYGRFRDR